MLLLFAAAASAVGAVLWLRAWKAQERQAQAREALSATQRGDWAVVRAAQESLSEIPGYESHVRVLRSATLMRSGRHAEAVAELFAVPAQGELREPVLLLLGEGLYRLDRLAEAELVLRQLVFEKPDHSRAHRWLATLYHRMGAMEAALGELEQVARLEPDDFFAFRLMGLIHKQDRVDHGLAIRYYRQALDRDPPPAHRAAIAYELADALVHQRQYEQALTILEQADRTASALALRAECLWNLGERRRADELLAEARRLDPAARAVLLLEASLGMEKSRPETAISALQRLLEQDPHDYQSRYRLALALRKSGEPSAAEREMEQMRDSQALHDRLSGLYARTMQNPDDVASRKELADVYRRLGKQELAAIWSRAADASRRSRQLRGGELQDVPRNHVVE